MGSDQNGKYKMARYIEVIEAKFNKNEHLFDEELNSDNISRSIRKKLSVKLIEIRKQLKLKYESKSDTIPEYCKIKERVEINREKLKLWTNAERAQRKKGRDATKAKWGKIHADKALEKEKKGKSARRRLPNNDRECTQCKGIGFE